jgi:hypothetical protein
MVVVAVGRKMRTLSPATENGRLQYGSAYVSLWGALTFKQSASRSAVMTARAALDSWRAKSNRTRCISTLTVSRCMAMISSCWSVAACCSCRLKPSFAN